MTVLTLHLSDQPIVTLPAELARLAGLEEGQVEVILDQHRVTVLPLSAADYEGHWESVSGALREQAAKFELASADVRDASYWETVRPLFVEAERLTSSM